MFFEEKSDVILIIFKLEPQNMILYGSRSFADRMEMRSYWIRVDPKANKNVLIRERKRQTGTHRE